MGKIGRENADELVQELEELDNNEEEVEAYEELPSCPICKDSMLFMQQQTCCMMAMTRLRCSIFSCMGTWQGACRGEGAMHAPVAAWICSM